MRSRHVLIGTGGTILIVGVAAFSAWARPEHQAAQADTRQPGVAGTLGPGIDNLTPLGPFGHPTAEPPFPRMPLPPLVGERGEGPTPIPTLSPLATGEFVNFESPQVKALAVSADGSRLYAANTPAGTLTVIDTRWGPDQLLRIVEEIPVGLDPVSVTVQPRAPGGGPDVVWVVNHISDDVSIVEVSPGAAGRVVKVIPVGDEPTNIVFSPGGAYAYVVLQGPPADAQPPFQQAPWLVTIDTAARTVVHSLRLDCNTARGAAYHAPTGRILIGALHSGNNTTVVGGAVGRAFPDGSFDIVTTLEVVRDFSATAALFAASPRLSPYPDIGAVPNTPRLHRIIPDLGEPSAWAAIVDVLAGPSGLPDPAMVARYAAETGVTNAFAILAQVIFEARNTVDNDVIVIDARPEGGAAPVVERIIGRVGTTLPGLGVHPLEERLLVSNLEPLNLIRLKPNLRGHVMDHQVVVVQGFTSASPTITRTDLHAGVANFNSTSAPNPLAMAASLANPVDIVCSADGSRAYVAALGPGRVGVLDGTTARVLARVDVGRGPRSPGDR